MRNDRKEFYKPVEEDGYTVKELLDILKDADPDSLIIIGRNHNDCDEYLYHITVGSALVGFFTEPEDN